MNRVLLVNDCKFENFIMRDMLINLGYEVIISNEYNAVSDVRELNCNLIIANYIMKEKTGDKILEQIKDLYPETKCILSSSNDIKLEDFNNSAIDGFIHTPVTKDKLQKIMGGNGQSLNKHSRKLKPSFCTYCGGKVDDGEKLVKFCKYCGENINFS
ncbi:two-component system response regulator [Clostridium sp. CF012]|uniref:response regulator n=1 Tax=Clostridium sp. CF012 TaxID=2843319 RepID=UPI001C0B9E16|nr:response regulator [Clostridium sp. CF012]MBU3143063.1 response regulator [Clostridium sp. CF012]